MSSTQPATLYVVATPIGNLDDLSPRARQVLANVDVIACEDTRGTRQLLSSNGLQTPTISLHEHNETQRIERLLNDLQAGKSVALVSDAGTPTISDPGARLIHALAAEGITISPIPGACAAVSALSIAGFPADAFVFVGFLPHKTKARQNALRDLASDSRSLVFYLSPHRIADELSDLAAVFGAERACVLCRELTKAHETIYRGTVVDVQTQIANDSHGDKGEFVAVISGSDEAQNNAALLTHTLSVLQQHVSDKSAIAIAAELHGVPKNQLKRLLSAD